MSVPLKNRLPALLFACGAVALASAATCVESDPPGDDGLPGEGVALPDGTVFTRRALLESLGRCIDSQQQQFVVVADALAAAARAARDDVTARPAAQAAWRDAMAVWQRLELMQVGPTGLTTAPGGQALRDQVYAWPLLNPCQMDTLLVSEGYAASSFSNALVNVKGLGAAEELLFRDGADNACDATASINVDGTWAALSADELARRRAAYAAVVASDIAVRARAITTSWAADGGNFRAEFEGAGDGSRLYGRSQLALNAASDALFYVEYADKDGKLGKPLGLTQCETETCLEAVESRHAGTSLQHLRENLRGFQQLFGGCDAGAGLGFDDFLVAVGSAELATQMNDDVNAALAALDAIDEADLAEAIVADRDSVLAVHAATKVITDDLRTQFLSILDLELPRRVEGDND